MRSGTAGIGIGNGDRAPGTTHQQGRCEHANTCSEAQMRNYPASDDYIDSASDGANDASAHGPSSGQSPCGSRPSQSSQLSWRLLRGAMMRRRSSSSNSSVDTCDRALALVGRSAYPWDAALGLVAAPCGHQLLGFPTGQDGVDAARRPGQLVLQHGVGAGAGLAHAVLDVGQGAHGERQAVGQIGAVAVAQCHAATHDVVAEPFQGASVHASHHDG